MRALIRMRVLEDPEESNSDSPLASIEMLYIKNRQDYVEVIHQIFRRYGYPTHYVRNENTDPSDPVNQNSYSGMLSTPNEDKIEDILETLYSVIPEQVNSYERPKVILVGYIPHGQAVFTVAAISAHFLHIRIHSDLFYRVRDSCIEIVRKMPPRSRIEGVRYSLETWLLTQIRYTKRAKRRDLREIEILDTLPNYTSHYLAKEVKLFCDDTIKVLEPGKEVPTVVGHVVGGISGAIRRGFYKNLAGMVSMLVIILAYSFYVLIFQNTGEFPVDKILPFMIGVLTPLVLTINDIWRIYRYGEIEWDMDAYNRNR